MATSNTPNGSDDPTSRETTLQSTQHLMSPEDFEAMMNALHQRGVDLGEQPTVTPDMLNMATGPSLPGTLDSETLKLKLNEAQKPFVTTKTFKNIRHSLEKSCHVTICGASGEGKTTMALMLGQKYLKQGFELVFVDRLDKFDFGSCLRSGQKICLIFDDIFGSIGRTTNLIDIQRLCDALKLHIDNNLQTRLTDKTEKQRPDTQKDNRKQKHKLCNPKSNEIRVIFTSKTYDFREGISQMQHQRVSMFSKSVVDLTANPGSSYSNQEKKAMFQKHREMHPKKMLGDLQVEDVIDQDSSNLFGFPLTCRLFFEYFAKEEDKHKDTAEHKEKEKVKAIDFFRRPIYYLRIELNNILSRRNDQSAALILVMLCEENLKLPDLESPNRNEKVDEMVGHIAKYTNSATWSGMAEAARSFRGTFFSRGDNLCFAHSSIYEACACALYQFNPTLVLEHCSLDFLYERLKPRLVDESAVSDQLHYLFVSEEYFPLVVTRFVSSLKEGIFSKTVAHPIMQNELFVKQFFEAIRHLATTDKSWIQFRESDKGFLYWVVKSQGTYLVKNIERFLQVKFTHNDIREALLASVECDSVNLYKFLICKLEGELDKSDLNKHLIASAKSSGDKMVKYLLEIGANVSTTDKGKQTILHLLCTYERPSILETVISHIDTKELALALNMVDKNKRTPLMIAALNGTFECFKLIETKVKEMLPHCAKASVCDVKGNTLLHLACVGGNKHIIESVLTPQNLNSRGWLGRTPVMVAARGANSDVFDLLLFKGADVSLVDDDKYTLLHLACDGGNKHIVESVLTPQNLNSRGWLGRTPVMVAAREANSDVFDLLLFKGADVSLVDDDKYTLLHLACDGGNKHIVESVLTPQNLNSRGGLGRSPIMVAARGANSDVFDLLLFKGADVSLVDDDKYTLLHLACAGGNKHIVESVLTPQNLNSRGGLGRSPIMVAARGANSDVFDLLLFKGADVSLVDDDKYTLLHLACAGGNKHIVESVLTPQNLNSRGGLERSPIMEAALGANSDVFDLLLSQGADVSLVDDDKDTLLHFASAGGNKHIVESVLTPQNLNSRGWLGRTPVMDAALGANSDVFDLLLSQGADVSLVDDDKHTLLHLACAGGNKHIVESVLTPQNLNSRGWLGRTPVMVAARGANSDVFDLLLSQGADVSLVDDDKHTLLHLACAGGNKHIVESVLTPQNLNSRGWLGRTSIMDAARGANSDVFDLLLSQGADVSLVDDDKDTLLHLACAGGNKCIVESVLTPQNLNSRNKYGSTPVMVAAREGHIKILDYLCEKGADLTCVTLDGKNVVAVAKHAKKSDIVRYLKSHLN